MIYEDFCEYFVFINFSRNFFVSFKHEFCLLLVLLCILLFVNVMFLQHIAFLCFSVYDNVVHFY